jgi:CDK-activating kinase assembly factor MAT1
LADKSKRDFYEVEKAITIAKLKFKQETTEVMLGERDQVSAEVAAAQMLGYRNELIRQRRGGGGVGFGANGCGGGGPRVREPEGGLTKDKVKDREMYRKRQAAGGGVTGDNIAVQERDYSGIIVFCTTKMSVKVVICIAVIMQRCLIICTRLSQFIT